MIEPYTGAKMKTVVTLYAICEGQDPTEIVKLTDGESTAPLINHDLKKVSFLLECLRDRHPTYTIQRFVHDGEQKVLLA